MAASRRRSGADMGLEGILTPIDQLDPDVAKIANKAMGLRDSNARMVAEVESMGAALDTTVAQLEHFMGMMVHLGVITDEQYWTMRLSWEENMRPQVQQHLKIMRARQAEMQARAIAPKLIVPGRN